MDNEYEQDRDFDMDIDNDLFDEDEAENVQLKSNVVQPMLLFKLNFEKNGPDLKAKVRDMIEECNSKTPNESEKYFKIAEGDGFAEIYKQTKRKERSTALYNTVIGNENETTSYITVYYADGGDVYAQTTGQAWRIASKYGDIHFPLKIARRLLDTKGMKEVEKIPLSGNTIFQRKRCKNPERSYETGTQNVRVRFAADLRSDASIRNPNLNCFENPRKKIKVKVGTAFIQFDSSIKVDGMKNFINHLNQIFNEKKTFTIEGRREENTDAFEESLRRADTREKECLDSALKRHMNSYILGNADFATHLSGLDLCQRSIYLFSYAHDFKIKIEKKKIPFSDVKPPTLENVLDIVSKQSSTTSLRQSIFPFDRIRILFQKNDKNGSKNLMDLVEGTMMYENQMCYRMYKEWYYMSEDHIRQIHLRFRIFLRNHFITDKERILPLAWHDGLDEGAYNNFYMKRADFLVGDDCLYGKVELFDLLRYDSATQHIYLYHVKKNLASEVRILAFQLMAATDILRNVWNDDALQMFQMYHASIVQKYRDMGAQVPKYFINFDDFRSLLSRPNKMTIICAVFDNGNYHYRKNSISRERDATDCFGVNEILEAYRKMNRFEKSVILNNIGGSNCSLSDICKLIFQLLIDNGYVKESDRTDYGHSTSKLLLSYHGDFMLFGPQNKIFDKTFNKAVWNLVQPFASLFTSTSAKYSLMRMQTNGFEFKICQIDRYGC